MNMNNYSVTRHIKSQTVIVPIGTMTRKDALIRYAIDLRKVIYYQANWCCSTMELHENGITLRQDFLSNGAITQAKLYPKQTSEA